MKVMKRKDLEIKLQKVQTFTDPDLRLEQYMTPATIAAEMAFMAYSNEDIMDRKVADLGCGTGMLSIAAALLGGQVVGVDIDPKALSLARLNAETAGVDIELVQSELDSFQGKVDTVLMNPPFGSQNRHADRPFLIKAMAISNVVYSLHMTETVEFLSRFVQPSGFSLDFQKSFKLDIPHTFAFHRKSRKSFDVSLLCLRRCGDLQ